MLETTSVIFNSQNTYDDVTARFFFAHGNATKRNAMKIILIMIGARRRMSSYYFYIFRERYKAVTKTNGNPVASNLFILLHFYIYNVTYFVRKRLAA